MPYPVCLGIDMLFIVRVSQFLFDESYRKFLLAYVVSSDIFYSYGLVFVLFCTVYSV